jgi:hypothetical protein
MTTMPRVRKLWLTAHVTASVGWFGALAVFLAHALTGLTTQDEQALRASALAMDVTARFVILPLCLATIATGLVQAFAVTKWGLFRHYWVLFKFLLTAIATAVLLLKLGPIGDLADAAAQVDVTPAVYTVRISLAVHAAGGLAILLAAVVLAIYKPGGMTAHGLRELRERNPAAAVSRIGTPRWVKVAGVLMLILFLLTVAMLLAGGHGPGAHYPRH